MNTSGTPSDSNTSSTTGSGTGRDTQGSSPSVKKPSKWRWPLRIGGGLVLLGGAAIFALPTIAGSVAPGIISEQAGKALAGSATVKATKFRWGGPQLIDGLVIKDQAGNEVARATIETSKGLLGLATGGLDIGEVVIRDAKLNITRDAEGKLNLAQLVKKDDAKAPAQGAAQKGSATGPITLPKGLKIKLKIDALDATLVDSSKGAPTTVALSNLKLNALVDPAKPLDVALEAKASAGSGTSQAQSGSISVALQANNWANASNQLALDTAQVKGDIKIAGLPVALIDGLVGSVIKDEAGKAVPLASVLGEQLGVQAKIDGSMKNASAAIDASTTNASAQGTLVITDGAVSQTGPFTVRLLGAALENIAPQLMTGAPQKAGTTPSPTTFAKLPDATITLSNLAVKLPKDGAPLDLRGVAAKVDVALSETRGTVQLPGRPAQALVIAPLSAAIETKDLAGQVVIGARTNATLNGQNAGDVDLAATLSKLLDDKGALRVGGAQGASATSTGPIVPFGVDATLNVRNMATVIAQPFVQSLGLDLSRDIGPTLQVASLVRSEGEGLGLSVDAKAQHLLAKANASLVGSRLTSGEGGFSLKLQSAGNVLGALTQSSDAVRVASSGSASTLSLDIPFFDVALVNNAPQLHQSKVQARVQAAGLSISVPGSNAPPVVLKTLDSTSYVLEQGRVEMGGQGSLAHAGTDFGFGYDIKVPSLLVAPAAGKAFAMADPWSLRPQGVVEIAGVPVSLLAMMPQADANTKEKPLDPAALVRELAGSQVTLKTNFAPSADGGKDGVALLTTLRSDRTQGDIRLVASDTQVFLQAAKVDTLLAPSVLQEVLRQFAPDLDPKPALESQATATLTIEPITIPLDAAKKPKLAQAGLLKGKLAVPDALVMGNLAKPATGDATTQQLSRVGVRGFALDFEAPLASLLPASQGGADGQAKATLRGGFLGGVAAGSVRDMGAMSGAVTASLSKGQPKSVDAAFNLENVPAAVLDALSGKPGLVTSALGGDVSVQLTSVIVPGAKATGEADFANANISARVSAAAPNLKMEPIAVRVQPKEIVLEQPATIELWTTPALAAQFLKPGEDGKAPALSLAQATTTRITLTELRLPRAGTDAAGKPTPATTPLRAQATVVVPGASLRTRENKTLALGEVKVQASTLNEATGPAANQAKAGDLAYGLSIATLALDGAAQSDRVGFEGFVRNLKDEAGAFSMQRAVVDVRGQVPAMPTLIADTLAQQDGLLVDALGDSVQLSLNVVGFPIGDDKSSGKGGTIDATFTSPRANAQLQGDIGESILVLQKPAKLSLSEITEGLSGRLVKGLPLVGSFDKKATDAPAAITASDMTIPLSKDFSKLNGVVVIDPGEANFATSGLFNELLNLAKLREAGQIGRRLEPITVTLTNGVATYPKWSLPLGEFTIATEGKVDLVNRQVDVVTWVPVGALADNAVGLFSSSKLLGGSVLEAASMVPFRTKGSLDKPTTSPDLQLFAETTVKKLNPVDVIQGIGDLFKKPKKAE